MALIFALSHISHPPLPKERFAGVDKLYHCIGYAGFSFWLTRAFFSLPIQRIASFVLSIVVVSIFGATDEWHQSFVKNRSPDVTDWIADCIGALLGGLLLVSWLRLWKWLNPKVFAAQNNDS